MNDYTVEEILALIDELRDHYEILQEQERYEEADGVAYCIRKIKRYFWIDE